MKHTLFTILLLYSSIFFSQKIISEDRLIKKDRELFFENSPFTGIVIKLDNNQIIEKYQVENGKTFGDKYVYFKDQDFSKEKFKDTSLIRKTENSIIEIKYKRGLLIEDSLEANNTLNIFIIQTIGGEKKLEKLLSKQTENKLKGKSIALWNAYSSLLNNYAVAGLESVKCNFELLNLQIQLKKELEKPESLLKINEKYLFEDGKKNGVYKEYHENGKLKSSGFYSLDLKMGNWIYYHNNGKIESEYTYLNGITNGNYSLYNINGTKTETGLNINGMLEGKISTYDADGKLTHESNYSNNLLNGLLLKYFKSGNIHFKISYLNGKQEGITNQFYENGKLENELMYHNGIAHGIFKVYYESGKIKNSANVDSTSMHEGKLIGDAINYNEDGTIESKFFIHKDGTIEDKTPKPISKISIKEMKKPYKCKCCKSTINGIYDAVDQDGNEASNFSIEIKLLLYDNPEYKKANMDLAKIFAEKLGSAYTPLSTYDAIRSDYKFCSMKCARTCYE